MPPAKGFPGGIALSDTRTEVIKKLAPNAFRNGATRRS